MLETVAIVCFFAVPAFAADGGIKAQIASERKGSTKVFEEALSPSVGFVWKAQLYLDWKNWIEPAGPFMLGCAGRRMREYHQSTMKPMQWQLDNDWIQNGKFAWESIRRLRAAKRPPKEFNAVPYNNPPFGFSTLCAAELFWNSDDPWEKIMMRARMRALPER